MPQGRQLQRLIETTPPGAGNRDALAVGPSEGFNCYSSYFFFFLPQITVSLNHSNRLK